MTEQQSIRMERVCYSIGSRTVLSDFDMVLEQGINRTILGVSGSGKTTILKLLLGLLQPQSGKSLLETWKLPVGQSLNIVSNAKNRRCFPGWGIV